MMRCLTDDDLMAEYSRRRAGEPLHFAAHLAACDICRSRFAHLRVADEVCRRYQEPASGPCPTPATLAGIAEGGLPRKQREAALTHIAGCTTCREMVAELALLQRETHPVSPRVPSIGWRQWLIPAFSACAGAAVMFMAITIHSLCGSIDTRVTPVAVRGDASANNAVAALRAVNPLSEEDRSFALDIWRSAMQETNHTLQDNPNDRQARHWRDVLRLGIKELTPAGAVPALKEKQ